MSLVYNSTSVLLIEYQKRGAFDSYFPCPVHKTLEPPVPIEKVKSFQIDLLLLIER